VPKARNKTKLRPSGAPKSPVQSARDAADALYRAAMECCHQHDRVSRITAKSDVDDELQVVRKVCEDCDKALQAMTKSYEETAADVRPEGDDEKWWRSANALWLASREYLRRQGGCEEASREFKDHGPDRLSGLQTEYELEASALLALRQAAEAYHRVRPAAK
jgi:hypothetical protein